MRIPLEPIFAAGAIPVRIVPLAGCDMQGAGSVRNDACSFCRALPNLLKSQPYQGLSALIANSSCDQIRRIMDTLRVELSIPVILFGAPRSWVEDDAYFLGEMKQAFSELWKILDVKPESEAILKQIAFRNNLNLKVQALRSENRLPNSILQHLAGSSLPPDELYEYLEKNQFEPAPPDKVRLLLAGSIPGIWEGEVIDQVGGEIVADATCLGDRVFENITAETGEVWKNLYKSYIADNLCPHRRPLNPLIKYLRDTIVNKNELDPIEGVVYRSLKFCHPWGLSAERIKSELGLPFLKVEDDLSSPAVANFRTRVGAFIEILRGKRRRKSA
jgi:benzoyl-CoA reductase/2-hydroxyglutaryl-CoA dehydratase subunit BcrC/BadD/HgdB